MIRVRAVTLRARQRVAGALFGRRDGASSASMVSIRSDTKGHMLFVFNRDLPGVLGSIATFIGNKGVNLGGFILAARRSRERARADSDDQADE